MKNLDDRRREWERELRDGQGGPKNYGNFQRGLRQGYIFYQKWAGQPLIPDASHGLRLIAGILIACGGIVLPFIGPAWIRIAVSVIGLVVAFTAFDFK